MCLLTFFSLGVFFFKQKTAYEVRISDGSSDVCYSDLNTVRAGTTVIRIAGRPVLFVLARAWAGAWPEDLPRETLIADAFRTRYADESHRSRLRVEIGRLRKILAPLAGLSATKRGFVLNPHSASTVAVLAPPAEGEHGKVLSLLADSAAWSSSALGLALGVRPRTVQRMLR